MKSLLVLSFMVLTIALFDAPTPSKNYNNFENGTSASR
jgi:hypothetical protein